MINEITVIARLADVIAEKLNDYITTQEGNIQIPAISRRNVVVDFPNTDTMPMSNMIYIVPNQASYENLSTESDNVEYTVNLFLLCKRDKKESLITKTYGYALALYSLLRNNTSLDGMVDFCEVEQHMFYPAVEGNEGITGMEIVTTIRFTKDF